MEESIFVLKLVGLIVTVVVCGTIVVKKACDFVDKTIQG